MSKFSVIILGGGPVGLFTAHALAAAGVDFVVLERQRDIVGYRGAALIVWPPTMRLLHQLGLYEKMLERGTPLSSKANFTAHESERLYQIPLFTTLEERLGYPTVGCSRNDLVRVLYENLPGRHRVKANAEVVKIENLGDGVRVLLANGSSVDGSIVIGTDGVHSLARRFINDASPTPNESKTPSPMVASYMTIFARAPSPDNVVMGEFAESHGRGVASQSLRTKDEILFTVLKPLSAPTSARTRFTSDDVERVARELSGTTIFPGVKLGEVWPRRDEASAVLVHQEEGLAEEWHHGRVVLAGDSCAKMTSANGQGAAQGLLSATALVNALRAKLRKNPQPSTQELNKLFAAYQDTRKEQCREVVNHGVAVARFISWTQPDFEATDRQESEVITAADIADGRLVPFLKSSEILDFMPFESKQGTVPWEHDGKGAIRARL